MKPMERRSTESVERVSAEEFTLQSQIPEDPTSSDILIIGNDIKGINYRIVNAAIPYMVMMCLALFRLKEL